MRLCSADFRQILRPNTFFNRKSAQHRDSRTLFAIAESAHPGLTLLYILISGTYSKIDSRILFAIAESVHPDLTLFYNLISETYSKTQFANFSKIRAEPAQPTFFLKNSGCAVST